MGLCNNTWGNPSLAHCKCSRVKGHKLSCKCQHGIEFPTLSEKTLKQIKQDMTYKEEQEHQ